MAKIALLIGSIRFDRQGIKVALWINKKLLERDHDVFFIDPVELNLPLMDRMYKEMKDPPENLVELRKKIVNAEGYLAVTPEYNHSTSAAMKNMLDIFLEEYYFKPSAIVCYSAGGFGGVNSAQHMRHIFAELGAPSISSSFAISKVREYFDREGNPNDPRAGERLDRFLKEFEWYIEAFSNQRKKGTPY